MCRNYCMNKNIHSNYFEGVLQLRNIDREFLDLVRKLISDDKRAIVAKDKYYDDGVDLYLSSQKYLRSLGKKLKERFPGELKITARLHTKSKTGKDLYRVTVFFKLYNFKRGDIFSYDGEKLQIIQINSKVLVKNMVSGKKQWMKIDEVEKFIVS